MGDEPVENNQSFENAGLIVQVVPNSPCIPQRVANRSTLDCPICVTPCQRVAQICIVKQIVD